MTLSKVVWKTDVKKQFMARTLRATRAATLQAKSEVFVMLSHPGSGRMYGAHQASAPGEPPAPNTGELRGSLVDTVSVNRGVVVGRVVENHEAAAHLEGGTENMAPRPHMRRALTEGWKRINAAFKANY